MVEFSSVEYTTDSYSSRLKRLPENHTHALQQKCGNWMTDFIAAIQRPDFSFDSYIGDYRETAEVIEGL